MDVELLSHLEQMETRLGKRLDGRIEQLEVRVAQRTDQRIEQLEVRLAQRSDQRIEQLEVRLAQRTDHLLEQMELRLREHTEHIETKLLTAFHSWASPNEARQRTHAAAIRALDVIVESLEDRVKKIEAAR